MAKLGELVNLRSFTIGAAQLVPAAGDEPETAVVRAQVQGVAGAPAEFEFRLRRKLIGPRKGAWTVHSLMRADDADT